MKSDVLVLMTVYNGVDYLRAAIDSILSQTFQDFRFLIVDDASTDESREMVNEYDDSRIELLKLEKNVGQTAALNVGLHHATQTWIARMDADDISAPNRLEEQMGVLNADPSIGILGTHAWTFSEDPDDPDGEIITPLDDAQIKHDLLRGSPLIHSSMVANREALLKVGSYDERYRYAADVELYDRLMKECKAANMPLKLYGVRIHAGQGTRTKTALNEIIEINSRRLSEGDYPPEARKIVGGALSRSHVVMARRLVGEAKPLGILKHLGKALGASPSTFAWYFPAVFVGYFLPASVSVTAKRAVSRLIGRA